MAIETNGSLFCAPVRQQRADEARALGRHVFERFLALVEQLDPWYATIALEWDLECPCDLMFDSRSFAFVNCYVSESCFGRAVVAELRRVYRGAYQQETPKGIYCSCVGDFNPEGRSLKPLRMQEVAANAGRVLADAFRRGNIGIGHGSG